MTEPTEPQRIADLLTDALNDRALTFRDAERLTGVSRSTIGFLTAGKLRNARDPRVRATLRRLVAALGLPADYFSLPDAAVDDATAGLTPLGAFVRRCRLGRGLSQYDFGHVDQSTISRIETDPAYVPTVPTLLLIAQTLNVDVGDLKELNHAGR